MARDPYCDSLKKKLTRLGYQGIESSQDLIILSAFAKLPSLVIIKSRTIGHRVVNNDASDNESLSDSGTSNVKDLSMKGVKGHMHGFLRTFAGLRSFQFELAVAQEDRENLYDDLFYVRDTLVRHAQNSLVYLNFRYTGAKMNYMGSLTAFNVLQRLIADWGSLIPAGSIREPELLVALPKSILKVVLFFDHRHDLVDEKGKIDHLINEKISRQSSLSMFVLAYLTKDAYSMIIASSLRKDAQAAKFELIPELKFLPDDRDTSGDSIMGD